MTIRVGEWPLESHEGNLQGRKRCMQHVDLLKVGCQVVSSASLPLGQSWFFPPFPLHLSSLTLKTSLCAHLFHSSALSHHLCSLQ